MSEIENYTANSADDEISLIDLVSVLIRHRMMIIIGTVLAFVLGAVYLFVYPALFPKAVKREITVEYSINVASIPGAIASKLPAKFNNLKNVVNAEVNDPVFLVKEMKKNNPYAAEDSKPLNDLELNKFVQTLLKDKKISSKSASIRDEIVVTMTIPEEGLDTATRMIDSMIATINENVERPFLLEVDKLKKTQQDTYDEIVKVYSENANIADAQSLMLNVRQIEEFLNDYKIVAFREVEPFVVLEPLGRMKKLIIVTFAAFFILIFAAFLNNAIYNIKKDPEASSKLKTAWDNGKLGKK